MSLNSDELSFIEPEIYHMYCAFSCEISWILFTQFKEVEYTSCRDCCTTHSFTTKIWFFITTQRSGVLIVDFRPVFYNIRRCERCPSILKYYIYLMSLQDTANFFSPFILPPFKIRFLYKFCRYSKCLCFI